MGLGGIAYARDSIIGLDQLVHDDEDVVRPRHVRRHSGNLSSSRTNGNDNNGGDNFIDKSDSTGSFETSLNDGLVASPNASKRSPLATPRKAAAVAAAKSQNKVSATNSRSLDSYRPSEVSSPSQSTVNAVHYQGFQYEGYTDYYSEDYNYNDFGYSTESRSEKKNIFCCLFAPWMQPKSIELDENSEDVTQEVEQAQAKEKETVASHDNKTELNPASEIAQVQASPTLSPTPSLKGSDVIATPTKPIERTQSSELPNLLHGVHTPKETNSVNFVPTPGSEKPTTPHMLSDGLDAMSTSPDDSLGFEEKKHEEGDIITKPPESVEKQEEEEEGPPPIKGILKVKRCSLVMSHKVLSRESLSIKAEKEPSPSPTNMRHLFPTYEAKSSQISNGGEIKAIDFNPMARVLTIPSRKDIPLHQKAQVWWQRCDYDEFKKTGRIISKAMECGGSEIWLASSNAWGNRSAQQRSSSSKIKIIVGDDGSKSVQKTSSDEEYNKALSKYDVNKGEKDDDSAEGGDTFGNKWWCKFGHSRRGLEHVASSTEGKARQGSVLLAIKMVMEEQKRQRASRTKDPNKLRNVAMQYTSWARDLSLAAGAADAEAVSSGFDPKAASRAQHFAKSLNVNPNSLHTLHQPDAVGGGVAMAVTSQILDANTHYTPRVKKNKAKDVNVGLDQYNDTLSRRATGYMPGGERNIGFRSVQV